MLKYKPVDRIREILCLPQDKFEKILIIPINKLPNDKTIRLLTKQVFLGQLQLFGKKNQSLQKKQASDLNAIGIRGKIGRHYHKGLLTVATRKEPIDILKIYKHIHAKIAHLHVCPDSSFSEDTQALLQGLDFCRQAQISTIHKPSLLKLLYKEHNVQLSQLGALMLPKKFFNNLLEPVLFVDSTGKKLGRLTELLYYRQNNQCK